MEIPAGTQAKWELDKASGHLVRDRRDGVRRVVPFLPYPASYGLVPRTLSPTPTGGDGDPLDVLLLGPALPRGAVVSARVVAVLRMMDEGERDDKLVAIPDGPAGDVFDGIDDLDALRDRRPGVTEVLETWLTHYDGPGVTVSDGWGGRDSASRLVAEAIDAYSAQ